MICLDKRAPGILNGLRTRRARGTLMSTMVATEPEVELQPKTTPKARVTPEELLAMPDAGRYELVDGQLRERKASFLSTVITGEIGRVLGNHCREHNLGWLPSAQQGYRCYPWAPGLVRMADVSFVRAERVTPELWDEGHVTIPPDLAVEVVSPHDKVEELDEKVNEYQRAGVKLVWVVHPALRAVAVFRSDKTVSWLWADDELSGEDVIPGFRCRVGDLFPKEAEDAPKTKPRRGRRTRPKPPGS
jgi:Uma2 family endonuclease